MTDKQKEEAAPRIRIRMSACAKLVAASVRVRPSVARGGGGGGGVLLLFSLLIPQFPPLLLQRVRWVSL